MELIGQLLRRRVIRCGDAGFIGLSGLIFQVVGLGILNERNLQPLQMRFGTVVLGIGDEDQAGAMAVALNFERASAALTAVIAQVVGPFCAPLLNDLLLN